MRIRKHELSHEDFEWFLADGLEWVGRAHFESLCKVMISAFNPEEVTKEQKILSYFLQGYNIVDAKDKQFPISGLLSDDRLLKFYNEMVMYRDPLVADIWSNLLYRDNSRLQHLIELQNGTVAAPSVHDAIPQEINVSDAEFEMICRALGNFNISDSRDENLWINTPLFIKAYTGYTILSPKQKLEFHPENLQIHFENILHSQVMRNDFVQENKRFSLVACNDDQGRLLILVCTHVLKSKDYNFLNLYLNQGMPSIGTVAITLKSIALWKNVAPIITLLNNYIEMHTRPQVHPHAHPIEILQQNLAALPRPVLNPNNNVESRKGKEAEQDDDLLALLSEPSDQGSNTIKNRIQDREEFVNKFVSECLFDKPSLDRDVLVEDHVPVVTHQQQMLDLQPPYLPHQFADQAVFYAVNPITTTATLGQTQMLGNVPMLGLQPNVYMANQFTDQAVFYPVDPMATTAALAQTQMLGNASMLDLPPNPYMANHFVDQHAFYPVNPVATTVALDPAQMLDNVQAVLQYQPPVTNAEPDTTTISIEEIKSDLKFNLEQIIIKRLNKLAKPAKPAKKDAVDEKKIFLQVLKHNDGNFLLPLPQHDLEKMTALINFACKRASFDPEKVAILSVSEFVLSFFKRYTILFYNYYDENGYPTGNGKDQFVLNVEDTSLLKALNAQNENMKFALVNERNLKHANEDITNTTLLINRVGYLEHQITDNKIKELQLIALIKPPVGSGQNQKRYSVQLILAKSDANGFSGFFEIDKMFHESQLKINAMQLVNSLNYTLRELFLKNDVVTDYSFATKAELEAFLKLVGENNDDPNYTMLTAIPAVSIPRKKNQNKKAAKASASLSNHRSGQRNNEASLVTTKIYKDKNRKRLAAPSSFEKNLAKEHVDQDELEVSVNNFAEYQMLMLTKFYQNANKEVRLARKKPPENYTPTKPLPRYVAQANLEPLFAEVEEAFSQNTGQSFKLFDYQREGIYEADLKQRVILCDEMGLGKTMQGVVTIKRQLMTMPEGNVCVLIVPASVVDRWQSDLIKAGVSPDKIIILMADAGIKKKTPLKDVTSKSIVLATYDSFVSRLKSKKDNCIKQLCGFIPRFPQELVRDEGVLDKIYKVIRDDVELRKAKLVSKEYVQKVSKQVEEYFFIRMPTDTELEALSSHSGMDAQVIKSLISWEIIYKHLTRNKFVNYAGALAVTKQSKKSKKSIKASLASLYQKHDLAIDKREVSSYLANRKSLFGIHNIVMDEAHHAVTSHNFFYLYAISKWLMKKSMLLITGTPLRNNYEELYKLHALLDSSYLDPETFERAFNIEKKSVANAIYSLVHNVNPQTIDVYKTSIHNLFDRMSKLIARQKQVRIRRTCEQTKTQNKIPPTVPADKTYELSEKQTKYITSVKRRDKISQLCRNYLPAQAGEDNVGKKKCKNKKGKDQKKDKKKSDLTIQRLEKYFNHPMLKNSKFGPKMFSKSEAEQIEAIEEYIRLHCKNDREIFIKQSGRLTKICEILKSHLDINKDTKIIVFNGFIPFATIIKYVMDKQYQITCKVFNGDLDTAARTRFEVDFNKNNAFPVALVSRRAGGEAITLYAETVVLESDWNTANREQMIRRAARTGSPYEIINVLNVFSNGNPVDTKQDSFSKFKELIEKFFSDHENTPIPGQLLDILISIIRLTASDSFKLAIESKRSLLHDLLREAPLLTATVTEAATVAATVTEAVTATATATAMTIAPASNSYAMPTSSTPSAETTNAQQSHKSHHARLFSHNFGHGDSVTTPNKRQMLIEPSSNSMEVIIDSEEQEIASAFSYWGPNI